MTQVIFDLAETAVNGTIFNGQGKALDVGPVGTVEPDPRILIPGMLTTKHTVIDSGQDPNRADLDYGGGNVPSPPGDPGLVPNTGYWWRTAMQFAAGYVPTTDGTRPQFNNVIDFHGNATVYTPVEIDVDYNTNNVILRVQGGGASTTVPTRTNVYQLFPCVPGETIDFHFYLFISSTSTGVCTCKWSRNGAAFSDTNAVFDTGPNISSSDSGMRIQVKNYRAGNHSFPTTSVYHTGWIRGDSEAELDLKTKGTKKVGYLDGSGNPIVGATSNTNTAGMRGSKFTMPENGTITHLASYLDFNGTAGGIECALAIYSDSSGVPGTKLAQGRVFSPDATSTDGFYEYALTRELDLTAGTVFWIIQMYQVNAAKVNWRGDAVGTGTFFSKNVVWANYGHPDTAGTNETGNANRTMSVYALYRTAAPPPSINLVTNPSFETDLGGWSKLDNGTPGTLTSTRDTTEAWVGGASLKLVETAAGQDDWEQFQVTGLIGGTTYVLSAGLKCPIFTSAALGNRALMAYDGVTALNTVLTAATSGWVRHSVTITLAPAATSLFIRLYAPQGTIYWDGVQLEAGSTMTPYVDATTSAVTSSVSTPLEARKGVVNTTVSPIEVTPSLVTATALAPFEALGAVSRAPSNPFESLTSGAAAGPFYSSATLTRLRVYTSIGGSTHEFVVTLPYTAQNDEEEWLLDQLLESYPALTKG